MGSFDEMAQAAARQKREQTEREQLQRQQAESTLTQRLEAEDRAMAEYVAPVLREAQKALEAAHVPCRANFNRNYPSFAKELIVGHDSPVRLKRLTLRVERAAGRFKVSLLTLEREVASETVDAPDVRAAIEKAYAKLLDQWHGVKPAT